MRWQLSQLCVVGTCDAGLPPAVVPLWQVAQVPAATLAWLNAAGVHADVRWQVSQLCVVGTWVAGFAVALLPLWQVAQVPAATPAWLNVAGVQPVVRWQTSHICEVTRWPDGLPFAVEPLWQLVHAPGGTPTWLKRAPLNVTVLWHSAHPCVVGGCDGGIPSALTRVPTWWHASQARGVPLKTPRTWHDSQGVLVCDPLSGKPVARWSKSARPWPAATGAASEASAKRSAASARGRIDRIIVASRRPRDVAPVRAAGSP